MSDLLYKKLWDLETLKRAWHLARVDTRTDFIMDSFRYNDFAFRLEENLQSISVALKNGAYHPKPLINIDVPKSTLSVRPGSVVSIEDRIVLFAITLLIAPRLDKKLLKTVYSYRVKKKKDKRSLFKDLEILKFPFLKGKTIRKRIDIIEPWYGQWPKFAEKTTRVFEEEGYNFLTVSDISAYFENINLLLLRDVLMKYFPKEQKIINLLYSLLTYWTWPTTHGFSIDRGIPQGNDVSSFLGNIYLMPLDEEFKKFIKKENVQYFRYMDDVRIFSKEPRVARECIFIMNNILRKLHLNIQGSKTIIKEGIEVKKELIDKHLDEVNAVIEEIKKTNIITRDARRGYGDRLKKQYRCIKKRGRIIKGKDLRLYRRLITAFTLIDSSYMVNDLLRQLPRNPDAKLLGKAVRYLKTFSRSCKKIAKNIMDFLKSPINLFPFQEARMVELLRHLNEMNQDSISYAKKCVRLKNKHWYVRVQSTLLLSNLYLKKKTLNKLKKIYQNSQNIELKRALVKCLCQLPKKDLDKFLRILIFENDNRLSSLGRMLFSLGYDKEIAKNEIISMFRHRREEIILDSYYKIEIIKYVNDRNIQRMLLRKLKNIKSIIKRKHLKIRINKTIEFIENLK